MRDLHKIWSHRWTSPKARPLNSKIHGKGLVAIKPVAKDEVVIAMGGVAVPRSDIARYRRIMGHIGAQVHKDMFIVPTTRKEIEMAGALNHSCNPNVGLSGSVVFVAIKKIKAGEEICTDYAFLESLFKPFKCKCGSKNCRGTINPNDWKRKDVQKKYAKYFSPYVRERFSL